MAEGPLNDNNNEAEGTPMALIAVSIPLNTEDAEKCHRDCPYLLKEEGCFLFDPEDGCSLEGVEKSGQWYRSRRCLKGEVRK